MEQLAQLQFHCGNPPPAAAPNTRTRISASDPPGASQSLFENSAGRCFHAKGWMARRDEGEYPLWIFDRGVTKPDGLWRENPPGGGVFASRPRWLVPYSPLAGMLGTRRLACRQNPTPQHLAEFSNRLSGGVNVGGALAANLDDFQTGLAPGFF
jgi:hypothetical protein